MLSMCIYIKLQYIYVSVLYLQVWVHLLLPSMYPNKSRFSIANGMAMYFGFANLSLPTCLNNM